MAAYCPLQSLILSTGPERTNLEFPGAGLSNLKHLDVTGFDPSTPSVDLQTLVCMTSLRLCGTGRQRSPLKSILLPLKLEVLTYLGYDLFLSSIKHNSYELPSLTKVRLHILYAECHSVCLPQLPLSTQHLVLAGKGWCRPDCDWSGLRGCPNVQHLTLAIGQQVFGQLELWIKSAKSLYVVDQSEDHWEQVISSKLTEFATTRLPTRYEYRF